MGAVGNTGMTRIVILAALVLGGIVILASGFGGGGAVAQAPGATNSPSGSPTPANSHSQSPTPQLSPKIDKVKVVIFNGGFDVPNVVPGLAAELQRKMEGDGYISLADATNAQTPVKRSIVYFTDHGNTAQNKVEAQYVAQHYLDNARVSQLGADFAETFPANAQVLILLGDDYVQAHGTNG